MSSAEATTGEDASNKPAFPLSPELRVKVYEQLLIHPGRSLKPNGFMYFTSGRPSREKDHIFTSILRTCRMFYEEALPILYGKNTLAFHDEDFSKPVLPFPKEHLTMVKHVVVDISPRIYSSARKMGQFLEALGTSGVNLIDLAITIHMHEIADEDSWEHHDGEGTLPPLDLFDYCLFGDHSIVEGLLSLKAVKSLSIRMEDEARFEPDFANALKYTFMVEGTADDRSITIEKRCTFPHGKLEWKERCPGCGNTEDDINNDTADWEYKDDMLSHKAVGKFLALGGELKKGKSPWANSKTGTAAKAKQHKAGAVATKPTGTAKKTKAKPAKPSSKKAA